MAGRVKLLDRASCRPLALPLLFLVGLISIVVITFFFLDPSVSDGNSGAAEQSPPRGNVTESADSLFSSFPPATTTPLGSIDLANPSSVVSNFPQSGEAMVPGDSGTRYFELYNTKPASVMNVFFYSEVTVTADEVLPAASKSQVEANFQVDLFYCTVGYLHSSSILGACSGPWSPMGASTGLGSAELETSGLALSSNVKSIINANAPAGIKAVVTMLPEASTDLMGTNFSVTWSASAN